MTVYANLLALRDAKNSVAENVPGRSAPSSTARIKQETGLIIQRHPAAYGKTLDEKWPEENIKLETDALLVSRVLGNMIINALGASAEGATVRITTRVEPGHITWEIWNNGFIPADVQKRVFQWHFSTKATFGRGLGTSSIKLFGERYLKGKVSFDSSESNGTTFRFWLPRC